MNRLFNKVINRRFCSSDFSITALVTYEIYFQSNRDRYLYRTIFMLSEICGSIASGSIIDSVNDKINDKIKLSDKEAAILRLIADEPSITYPTIAVRLSISVPTISRAVGRFLKEGIIVRQGSKKTGYWELTEKGRIEGIWLKKRIFWETNSELKRYKTTRGWVLIPSSISISC